MGRLWATVGCARGVDAGRASEGLVAQDCAVICFRQYAWSGGHETQLSRPRKKDCTGAKHWTDLTGL